MELFVRRRRSKDLGERSPHTPEPAWRRVALVRVQCAHCSVRDGRETGDGGRGTGDGRRETEMHWHWHRLWLWLWLALDMCKERPRIGDSLTTRAGKERPSDARTSVSTSVSSATATAYPVLSSPVPSLSRTVLLLYTTTSSPLPSPPSPPSSPSSTPPHPCQPSTPSRNSHQLKQPPSLVD